MPFQTPSEARLIADYADLGVSCGYIGNVTPTRDDRQFQVFTRLSTHPSAPACNISVVVYRVDGRVEYDTPAVRERLDRVRARLARGELFRVGA